MRNGSARGARGPGEHLRPAESVTVEPLGASLPEPGLIADDVAQPDVQRALLELTSKPAASQLGDGLVDAGAAHAVRHLDQLGADGDDEGTVSPRNSVPSGGDCEITSPSGTESEYCS